MAVNLSKGSKISLAKAASDSGVTNAITKVMVGLGWDTNAYDGGHDFDLDASVFLCDASGKCKSDSNFVFYNNKTAPGVEHMGDNRTGAGDGDDEVINIDLTALAPDVEKLDFVVTIYAAKVRNQNFGQVSNAYIRVVDATSGTEFIRYDLGEDFSIEAAVVVGSLYKHNGEWKFNAIGSGWQDGELASLCRNYGLDA